MSVHDRLKELGIELPSPVQPIATYVRYHQVGNLLLISGTGPSAGAKPGKLGLDLTIEEGYDIARDVGINIISTVNDALGGDLDRVQRCLKVLGMVNSAPDFADQPKVINGCSDLMVEVFGEKGRHTRSAVGFVALPGSIAVEIEAMFEVT
ncbi:MAG: RidA family protein [Thermomicrobiales bacterium]